MKTLLIFLVAVVISWGTEFNIIKESSSSNPYGPIYLQVSEDNDTVSMKINNGHPYMGIYIINGSGKGSLKKGEVVIKNKQSFPKDENNTGINVLSYENGRIYEQELLFSYSHWAETGSSFTNGHATGSSHTKLRASLIFFSRPISVVFEKRTTYQKWASPKETGDTTIVANLLRIYRKGVDSCEVKNIEVAGDSVASIYQVENGINIILSSGEKIIILSEQTNIKESKIIPSKFNCPQKRFPIMYDPSGRNMGPYSDKQLLARGMYFSPNFKRLKIK